MSDENVRTYGVAALPGDGIGPTAWAGAAMLEHFGQVDAAHEVVGAVETMLVSKASPKTRGLGGSAGTKDITEALVGALAPVSNAS